MPVGVHKRLGMGLRGVTLVGELVSMTYVRLEGLRTASHCSCVLAILLAMFFVLGDSDGELIIPRLVEAWTLRTKPLLFFESSDKIGSFVFCLHTEFPMRT